MDAGHRRLGTLANNLPLTSISSPVDETPLHIIRIHLAIRTVTIPVNAFPTPALHARTSMDVRMVEVDHLYMIEIGVHLHHTRRIMHLFTRTVMLLNMLHNLFMCIHLLFLSISLGMERIPARRTPQNKSEHRQRCNRLDQST
jgi:hypothetical protein